MLIEYLPTAIIALFVASLFLFVVSKLKKGKKSGKYKCCNCPYKDKCNKKNKK